MSDIYGALGLNNTDNQRTFVSTIGQQAIYDAVAYVFGIHNADMESAMRLFVDQTTDSFKMRYMLPGGGYLQKGGSQSLPAAKKATSSWDVAFPLESWGAGLSADRVAWAYMTLADLDRHLNSVFMANANTVRREILRALFNNTAATFSDPLRGDLTIQRLANNDGTVYPPVLGSDVDTTGYNAYLASGYVYTAIDNTHNPIPTIVNSLEQFFGTPTGGSPVVVFCNNEESPYFEALTEFVPFTLNTVIPGDDRDTVNVGSIPREVFDPSDPRRNTWRVLGTINGAVIVEWRAIPATYLLGIHVEAPKPIIQRIDLAGTGLTPGLQLVKTNDVTPFTSSYYDNRFGMGVGNRLNGVVMQLTAGGYTVPTQFQ